MITRFRIEAQGKTKKEVVQALTKASRAVVALEGKQGKWEITDEAITGNPGRYQGRIVVKLHD